MKTAFLVQARMGSTRLPHKILRPFYNNNCILDLLINKLNLIIDAKIIIATSVSSENDVIEKFCKEHGIVCFRGEENDVLKRFIDAAETNGVDKIIRICSDNPFLELNSIKKLIEVSSNSDAEYISFDINGCPSIKTHFGFWAEYVSLDALKKVQCLTDERIYHEHVTNYIYTNPEIFKLEWIEGPICLKGRSNIRLTIDTIEDFTNARSVYAELCKVNPYPTIDEVVSYLDEHPDIYNAMVQQINKNSK
ncbi:MULTISPECIES: cytidylyltransferase domain-containing protein [Bacteroides]|jgi:hypothetical protein|uniref:Glycosyl transferase family 2 n=1 Tax=Bacteroides zhangwenhongii TaxID=2650157 RepID=A0ABT5H5Q5_9BACE|nr:MULTISPECIES: glycosyl transferase family 2 [Bacteroides]MBC5586020.1 glycosyl transferase family 2 [Bacteroides sp. NSJ-39]MDC7135787.1 glycosyl transferase family 2 [Bacteroides zhangwenhongii]OKZ22260.1 MAG: glycosyl transferase family 2 [Bacteroides finegoldii]